jgi:hypothetical protein
MNEPSPTDNELAWTRYLAWKMGGEPEVVLPCRSRVDILTSTLALEVDWVKKWPEAIGQAVYYGVQTNRSAAVLLLLRGKDTEQKYIKRCKQACDKLGLSVFTWVTSY